MQCNCWVASHFWSDSCTVPYHSQYYIWISLVYAAIWVVLALELIYFHRWLALPGCCLKKITWHFMSSWWTLTVKTKISICSYFYLIENVFTENRTFWHEHPTRKYLKSIQYSLFVAFTVLPCVVPKNIFKFPVMSSRPLLVMFNVIHISVEGLCFRLLCPCTHAA